MSTDPATPAAAPTTTWPALSLSERRVLGVLAEKQKTTPAAYPMTLNALVTGCNQKSNRDPVLNLSEDQVEEALRGVQKQGLAIRLSGSGRVEKWRHGLYEAWNVNKAEMAVLTELLVRDPQTEGELRSRVSRMEPIDDLDALRAVLRPLIERRLVVYLTPEGRRGTMVTHGFHAPAELERLRAAMPTEAPLPAATAAPPPAAETGAGVEVRLAEAEAQMAALRATVTDLEVALQALTEQVRQIKEGLGM
jgi:uncharacterized protein YceH (UPF0502 family)